MSKYYYLCQCGLFLLDEIELAEMGPGPGPGPSVDRGPIRVPSPHPQIILSGKTLGHSYVVCTYKSDELKKKLK